MNLFWKHNHVRNSVLQDNLWQLLQYTESDLYHAGIKGNISRATLSYANNHRDSKVFEDFYFRLLDYYKKLVDPSLMKSEGKNLKLIA